MLSQPRGLASPWRAAARWGGDPARLATRATRLLRPSRETLDGMSQPNPLSLVGSTPLIEADGVFCKLECSNPTGSVKDRIAKFLLESAMRRGELKPGDTVVEATSGNTGIAMSHAARALGCKAMIFMPEHMSEERIALMRELGAEVRLTPRDESFEGSVKRRDEYRGRPGYFVPDQFGNPENPLCHEQTTGAELVAQLKSQGIEHLDAFVAGTGTGGSLMGVARALRREWPDVRIVAVEPTESAVMLGETAGEHGIQGIGDGFIPPIVDMSEVSEVATVSTDEAHAEATRIHEQLGHCVGRSSGANMLVARNLAARGMRVATLWPDCSDRYVSLGLEPPSSEHTTCSLHDQCALRRADVLTPPKPRSG